jgi:hypothetical protein
MESPLYTALRVKTFILLGEILHDQIQAVRRVGFPFNVKPGSIASIRT